ncbi:hypothetical protein BJ742DRAFT_777003 [Cladochytrium replicatum]|nr:hypothetical protein BJ742DRAFT_777003 [Cladochytrium replicatum]
MNWIIVLPLGWDVFSDPFELDNLNAGHVKAGRSITFHSFGKPDLEAPADSEHARSNIVVVEAQLEIASSALAVAIPVHLRYQPPSHSGSFGQVQLPMPQVYTRLSSNDPG